MLEIDFNNVKNWSELFRNVATVVGAVLAFVWFLTTRAYKRHSEVNLSCRAFPLIPPSDGTLAEIGVVFENKGTRRQTLTNLTLCDEQLKKVNAPENATLVPSWTPLGTHEVPELTPDSPFIVLKGISQEFTETLVVPSDIDLIHVTATFRSSGAVTSGEGVAHIPYPSKRTARRVFDLRVKGIDKTDSSGRAP